MRHRLLAWVLLLMSLLALAAAACGEEGAPAVNTGTPTTAGFPVTVSDSNGNQVTFSAPPERIVALTPSFVETLFAIGAGHALVAVDQNSDFPAEAAALPKVSGFEPSIEAIAGMEPDLVLISYDPGDLQASLERLGIPVLFLAWSESMEGILGQLRLLGQATGHVAEAEALVADMQRRIEAVRAKLSDVVQGPRVFHEIDPALFTACPGDFIHDMYVILKAQNIASQPAVPCQLSQEAVIGADPEVIILADEPAGITVESVKARPGWANISAVKEDRVFLVDSNIVHRPGPRLVEGLETLARLLYPEMFD